MPAVYFSFLIDQEPPRLKVGFWFFIYEVYKIFGEWIILYIFNFKEDFHFLLNLEVP
ncbi:hypothetical protein C4K18_0239 [Pseudomonas chlororaphis subsp. aurantiaca]|nr:hypothetical protein C4K18_0239 [Pseudomonas chlororaphis subsp. aurantiaca]